MYKTDSLQKYVDNRFDANDEIVDVSYIFTSTATDFEAKAIKCGHVVMFHISGKTSSEGDFADINKFVPAFNATMNVLAETGSGAQIDGVLQVKGDAIATIQVWGLSSSDTVYVSGTYITW